MQTTVEYPARDVSVKGIFTVTGLDGIFEVADDKFVALASLQIID